MSAIELLEDMLKVLFANALAIIGYADDRVTILFIEIQSDQAVRRAITMFDGVIEQNKKQLFNALAVGLDTQTLMGCQREHDFAAITGARSRLLNTFRSQLDYINILCFQRAAVIQACKRQQVINQACHALGFAFHTRQHASGRLWIVGCPAHQYFSKAANRGKRSAELVRSVGEETLKTLLRTVLH